MKHLTEQDLLVLIKLVNQASDQFAAVEDTAQVIRRHDREYKALPAEDITEASAATIAVHDAQRKLRVIRDRLIKELAGLPVDQKAGLTSAP